MNKEDRDRKMGEFKRMALEAAETVKEGTEALAVKFRRILAKRALTQKENAEFNRMHNLSNFLKDLKLVKEDAIMNMDLGEFSTYVSVNYN